MKNLVSTFGPNVFDHLCIIYNGWSFSTENLHVRIEANQDEKKRRKQIWDILRSEIPELGEKMIPIFLLECSELNENYGWLSREQFYKFIALAESKTALDGTKLVDAEYFIENSKDCLGREKPLDVEALKRAVKTQADQEVVGELLQTQEAIKLFKTCKADEGGLLFTFLSTDGKATFDSAIKAAKALSMAFDEGVSLEIDDLKEIIKTQVAQEPFVDLLQI